MTHPVRMRRVVVLGLMVYVVALVAAAPTLWRQSSLRRVVGWSSARIGGVPAVSSVDAAGPAARKLEVSDRILAVEDTTDFPRNYLPHHRISSYEPGQSYSIRVLRGSRTLDYRLQIVTRPDHSALPFIWSFLMASLTFLATGMLMGWKRPDLRAAQLGWLACQLTSLIYISLMLQAVEGLGWPVSTARLALRPIGCWNLLAAWWFVAAFPFPLPESRPWRAVRWGLAGLTLVDTAFVISYVLAVISGYRLWAVWPTWVGSWTLLAYRAPRLALVAALPAVVIRNYRLHRDPASRRRIEIVAGAILIGVIFSSSAAIYNSLYRGGPGDWVLSLGNLAPLPIPLFFNYAVVQHSVFDIRLIARRSLRYLLARQVLRVLTLVPVALLAIRMFSNPNAPIGSLLNVAGVGLILSAGFCLEYRTRILGSVDRWFFRSALDRENMLRDLLVEITRLGSLEEVEGTVKARLAAIFSPESVALSSDSSAQAEPGGLCLPIRAPGGLVEGCLLLGRKQSEQPYTDSERDLLEAVAAQIGLVRESLLAAEERFNAVLEERNRIARELHDTLSQGFAGISLHLEAVRKAMAVAPEQARESLDAARSLARESMQEARNSVRNLRAADPASHLEVRLRALANRSPEGPKVSVEVPSGVGAMASADAGWHLARVAEEAVTNAFKHSRATQVEVELKPSGPQLVLRIRDNGKGFDPASAGDRGFGLLGMRERMDELHGSVEIISAPGWGTEVRAQVPVAV